MALLPALQLIVSLLPSLLGPPLVTCLVLTYIPLHIPGLLIAILAAVSLPLVAYASLKWRDFRDKRDAERLGAVLPPRVRDPTFFNTTPLTIAVDNMKHGVLGEHILYVVMSAPSISVSSISVTSGENFSRWHDQYGNSFNWRVLSENRV